jgi:glutathione synthase/RimK-type ligase-like ATP-grasp enzyme
MKLILANNQSVKFRQFYEQLQSVSREPFEYSGYTSLLFIFNTDDSSPIRIINLASQRELADYSGVYINGYLKTYELAAAVAISCQSIGLGFANRELEQAPSLSKLSMYTKLAAAGVRLPQSFAGSKQALLEAGDYLRELTFPAVLKRADADRGIDNYQVADLDEMAQLLSQHETDSLWVLQEYISNDGFYLISYYGGEPKFCIFRSLQTRPDGNQQKAHMYKPKGGSNARLIEVNDVAKPILQTCQQAVQAMNRQIASVDCLYDEASQKVYVLEVNYNPQLVTIETFKDVRIQAFLDYLPSIGT